MFRSFIAAVVLLVIGAPLAYATPVQPTITIKGTYTVTQTQTGGQVGNKPTITDDLKSNFTEILTIGKATNPTSFFTISPAGTSGINCGRHCNGTNDIASDTITVTFTFTDPSGATGNLVETGIYQANYDGTLSCSSSRGSQTDCIDWSKTNDPIEVTFSDGIELLVTLYDAQDWDIVPKISFEAFQNPVQKPDPKPVPEPASLVIFGAALIGGFGARRLRKMRR